MNALRKLGWLAALVVVAGCATGTDTDGSVTAGLQIDMGEEVTTGSLALGEELITFEATLVEAGVYEIDIELRGMLIDALIDFDAGVSNLDAFTAEDGSDTQLLDEDRALLAALYAALNELPREEMSEEAIMLRRVAGLYAEHPTSLDPAQVVMGEEGRGYTMLCSYTDCGYGQTGGSCAGWNWYYYGDHDCCRSWWGGDCHGFGDGDGRNQQRVQLGDHFSCSGDEFYWNGSTWACGEPDHWSRPYVVGNCFGRSGSGCGGDTQYTRDATNHDGCVRNGHDLLSLYCDDQFISAADDELYAPNCY